jgi:hypothetical protein
MIVRDKLAGPTKIQTEAPPIPASTQLTNDLAKEAAYASRQIIATANFMARCALEW